MVLMILTCISYAFLNHSNMLHNGWKFAAIAVYPFLLTFGTGNFRILLKYMVWYKRRVVIYKLQRIYACAIYMYLGSMNMVNPSPNLDTDMYLLYLFTCLSYMA